jgi:hypothetical protein
MRFLLASPLRSRATRALAVLAVALAIPAAASASGITAHFSAPNHQPTANKKFPITVTARKGATKLNGTVSYAFLLGSTVEARRPGHRLRNGVCHDTLLFPKAAIGHTITLQTIVTTRYGTVKFNWWIKTKA